MQSKERILAKNTVMLYIMQISSYVFPLLSFPYLTRVLGAEKYGIVVFANSIMSYFTLFIEFGFLLSGTKICSDFCNNKEKLGDITFGIIQAKLLLVILSAFALILSCMFVQKIRQDSVFFILSFIGIFLTVFLPDFLFRGIEQMEILTYRVVAAKFIYTGLIFLFIKDESDYLLVPLAIIGSNIFAVILTWAEIIRKKIILFSRVSFKQTFKYLKDSSLFFLSRIAATFYSSLNTVILGFKFPSSQVGQYGVANTLTNTCRSLMSPISDSIYPYMIKQKNFRLVKKIILILEPLILACCAVLWIIAEPTVKFVCGQGYENVVPMLRAMVPIIAITLPAYLFGYPVLGALNQTKWANLSVVISASFHIVGLISLFVFEKIGFIQVIVLACITQFIELGIRICVIFRELKKRREEHEN